jgi:glycosyltransferase involved in cell wall biosynthesis
MKKVLIITYYWPPAGGPGVQRVLKFSQYMVEYGWQPIVLTVNNGEYPGLDPGLEKKIPDSCLVFKTDSREPGSLYKRFVGMKQSEAIPVAVLTEKKNSWRKKLANWIRLNLIIPDAKIGWKPFALKEGEKIINKYQPDIIFSSSPPPTVHLIAKALSKKMGVKWIADFRDPWTKIHYYNQLPKNKLSQRIDKNLEKEVLKATDKITVVNQDFFDEIDKQKEVVIPNGFDLSDFPVIKIKNRNDKFTICYAGSFKTRQFLDSFFDALNEIVLDMDISNFIILEFLGNVDPIIKQKIESKKLPCEINFVGFVGHDQVLKKIIQADLLLLVIGKSDCAPHILSTKVFEYLNARKPILAFGPENGAVDKLLQKTKSGKLFNYDDKDNAIRYLRDQVQKWKDNIVYTDFDNEQISKYNRKTLTKKLVNIFEEIL